MTRRRMLITGATGRLGRLVDDHFAGEFELRRLCLNPGGSPDVQTADLSVVDTRWTEAFDGVDVVVHCAGQAQPSSRWSDVQRHNVDATLNVFEAAARAHVGRIVFMSSNWAMEGYRFRRERLVESLPPLPTNPYGVSKVVGERIARSFAEHRGLPAVCLRIGYCAGVAPDDARLARSAWVRQKWLSDRDYLQLVERAVETRAVRFAIVNGVSDNAGRRWDLELGRRLLGYTPADGLDEAGIVAGLRDFAQRFTRGAVRRRQWAVS